jgi:molecular chaperone GrpE
VTMIPVPDKQTNDIVDVVQIGFTLNDRVLRPAMVVVAQ